MVDDCDCTAVLDHVPAPTARQLALPGAVPPDTRRLLSHPDQLRVAMRKAGTRQDAVDRRGRTRILVERGLDSLLPDLGDEHRGGRMREGRTHPACESRPPGARTPGRGSARREPARDLRSGRLRRRLVFPADVEGAAIDLLGRGLGLPAGATRLDDHRGGRDDHPATRQRVFADLGQLPESRRSRSSRGLTRSIGSGRISVDERSELISSIVCR